MNLTTFLEKFGRTLLERPLASGSHPEEPPELAEVRLAVLDRVRDQSYPSGGRKIFPFDLVRLEMRGVEASSAAVFAGGFFRKYLEQEIRSALRHAGCRYPEELRVDVEVTPDLPLNGEPWLAVKLAQQDRAAGGRRAPRLVVREGTANVAEIRLEKARTNIGRAVDVVRSEGLFRRNDLAFAEDTEINRSVSREHAHIRFDKVSGEYRVFNDRWYPRGSHDCGIWIVRDGLSQEVHRNARGTKLEPGDEIHLGRAVVTFEAE